MISKAFAQRFAGDWIGAWNEDQMDRLLGYFSADFQEWAPAISQVTGEAAGILWGTEAVAASWAEARRLLPDVRFSLTSVLAGTRDVTVYYVGVRGRLAAETFCFGPDLRVVRVFTMMGEPLSAWPIIARRAA
jgi:ketosteroid isomerase-like protein